MSGISGVNPSHVGMASQTRTQNTLSNIGNAAFNTVMTGAQAAAGAFGGPAAASAVSAMRTGVASSGGGSGDTVGQVVDMTNAQRDQSMNRAGSEALQDQDFQLDLFRLQRSVNAMSQTNNMIANMQKARHDAMMATIQNVR